LDIYSSSSAGPVTNFAWLKGRFNSCMACWQDGELIPALVQNWKQA
jgi:hypothetical protein